MGAGRREVKSPWFARQRRRMLGLPRKGASDEKYPPQDRCRDSGLACRRFDGGWTPERVYQWAGRGDTGTGLVLCFDCYPSKIQNIDYRPFRAGSFRGAFYYAGDHDVSRGPACSLGCNWIRCWWSRGSRCRLYEYLDFDLHHGRLSDRMVRERFRSAFGTHIHRGGRATALARDAFTGIAGQHDHLDRRPTGPKSLLLPAQHSGWYQRDSTRTEHEPDGDSLCHHLRHEQLGRDDSGNCWHEPGRLLSLPQPFVNRSA